MDYRQVQQIAKDTIAYLENIIAPGVSLPELRRMAEEKMLTLGADSFWYWDVGAFVFAGDETTVSVSGREYKTSPHMIDRNDIITVDLSPQWRDIWGDYARTLVLEEGRVVCSPEEIKNPQWRKGLEMEQLLHAELFRFATPDTSFEQLFEHMNALIVEKGFINLDFSGNLGHSIVRQKGDRIYIEKGNQCRLGDVAFFTFEPHISVPGSCYGYKMENIYYFVNGKLTEL